MGLYKGGWSWILLLVTLLLRSSRGIIYKSERYSPGYEKHLDATISLSLSFSLSLSVSPGHHQRGFAAQVIASGGSGGVLSEYTTRGGISHDADKLGVKDVEVSLGSDGERFLNRSHEKHEILFTDEIRYFSILVFRYFRYLVF